MDLKSRGRMGRSFMHRAVHRVTRNEQRPSVSDSNIEDAELTKKVEALFSQELLFERLHTEPKWKRAYVTTAKGVKHTASFVKKQKFATKVAAAIILVVMMGGVLRVSYSPKGTSAKKPDITKVAGATNTNGSSQYDSPQDKSLISVKDLDFEPVLPSGLTLDEIIKKEVRKTPEGIITLTYQSDLQGKEFLVYEQAVSGKLKTDLEAEMANIAKGYSLSEKFQVDSTTVYHGYSSKTNVQILAFSKLGALVFIQSTNRFNDDEWVGYIAGLK